MRTPSRRMPAAPERPVVEPGVVVGCLVTIVGLVSAWGYFWPWAFLGHALLAVFTLFTIEANWADERRLSQLKAERQGESICTFARSLDFRAIDTWIIRAVYEELQATCGMLPIRATDRLGDDLAITEEDCDDLVADIASRSGRRLDSTEANPYFGQVETVHDLVQFLTLQPQVGTTEISTRVDHKSELEEAFRRGIFSLAEWMIEMVRPLDYTWPAWDRDVEIDWVR